MQASVGRSILSGWQDVEGSGFRLGPPKTQTCLLLAKAAVVLTRFLGPVAWRQGAIDTQHPEFPYPNPDRKSESPGATTTPAMELFGTAWSGLLVYRVCGPAGIVHL